MIPVFAVECSCPDCDSTLIPTIRGWLRVQWAYHVHLEDWFCPGCTNHGCTRTINRHPPPRNNLSAPNGDLWMDALVVGFVIAATIAFVLFLLLTMYRVV